MRASGAASSRRGGPALAAQMPGKGRLPTYAWGELFTDGPGSGVAAVVLLRGATGDDAASGAKLLLDTLRDQGVLACA